MPHQNLPQRGPSEQKHEERVGSLQNPHQLNQHPQSSGLQDELARKLKERNQVLLTLRNSLYLNTHSVAKLDTRRERHPRNQQKTEEQEVRSWFQTSFLKTFSSDSHDQDSTNSMHRNPVSPRSHGGDQAKVSTSKVSKLWFAIEHHSQDCLRERQRNPCFVQYEEEYEQSGQYWPFWTTNSFTVWQSWRQYAWQIGYGGGPQSAGKDQPKGLHIW